MQEQDNRITISTKVITTIFLWALDTDICSVRAWPLKRNCTWANNVNAAASSTASPVIALSEEVIPSTWLGDQLLSPLIYVTLVQMAWALLSNISQFFYEITLYLFCLTSSAYCFVAVLVMYFGTIWTLKLWHGAARLARPGSNSNACNIRLLK